MALELFFGSATQYYIAGRFAVLAGQIPIAGNLLHHAVEMYLKGGLSKTHSLPQLKCMAHDLPKIWATFKTQFGSSTLNEFDDVVVALHQFEELRYPNSILARGAAIRMGIERMKPVALATVARTEPAYEVFLADVDALVRAVFTIVSVNPGFFFDALPTKAKEHLLELNRQEWAGSQRLAADTDLVNHETVAAEADAVSPTKTMLTLRQAGAVGIKLLGVSYLARTVMAAFSLVALRFTQSGFNADDDFAAAQVVGTLGYPLAAWLLLGTGDDLASRLFPATPVSTNFGARELLVVGVAIVGLSMAVSALPALIQGIGTAVYYAEGTRQQFAEARFEGQLPGLIREALTLVTGLAVAAASKPIAAKCRAASE